MSDEQVNSKIIKFSTMEDEGFRAEVKKVHALSVLLKGAGFPIRTMLGRVESQVLRKHHNLPRKNDLSMIEFQDCGEEKNNEIKDWLTMNTKAIVVSDSLYVYNDEVQVYQIILDCTKL